MRYALAVNEINADIEKNLLNILNMIDAAKMNNLNMVIFPEAAFSGLCNNDNPDNDFKLCLSANSKTLRAISQKAKECQMYIIIGFLELYEGSIYDSVICFDNNGEIISKYNRISIGWHGAKADPTLYKEGKDVVEFTINRKKHAYLICGDLFDDELITAVKSMSVDILIVPLARSLKDSYNTQMKWENEELDYYSSQCKQSGALCLLVNYFNKDTSDGYYFGGAHVIDNGITADRLEVGKSGILYYDDDGL